MLMCTVYYTIYSHIGLVTLIKKLKSTEYSVGELTIKRHVFGISMEGSKTVGCMFKIIWDAALNKLGKKMGQRVIARTGNYVNHNAFLMVQQ